MQGPYLRKYGVETTIDFTLFEIDGVDFKVDAVHASGDTKVMKDEGAEANTTNGFVDEGTGYSITLTLTEMTAARIVVYVVDQGTKAWLDTALVIETYGHASAQHAFDLDTATVTLADGGITAAKLATDCFTSDELAASAIAEIVAAIFAQAIDGAQDFLEKQRLDLAAIGGKSTGGGTDTVNFRDQGDAKNRITATVDEDGNRTAVSLDGS